LIVRASNIELMCRKARRKLHAEVDAQVAKAKAEITAEFQRLRRTHGLPPIALIGLKYYRLPKQFECPECGGRTLFEVDEWSTSTGMPSAGGIRVLCEAEEEEFDRAMQADEDPGWQHRHWQDTGWMSLIRRVERFCASRVRIFDL